MTLRLEKVIEDRELPGKDLQMAFDFNLTQAIYKWQNGTALPTVDNLIGLAALLRIQIDDILIAHSVA